MYGWVFDLIKRSESKIYLTCMRVLSVEQAEFCDRPLSLEEQSNYKVNRDQITVAK